MSESYTLVREKREWVPERVWRMFCFANLPTWQPFTAILTRRPDHA